MQAELIHPLDLCEKINEKCPLGSTMKITYGQGNPIDDLVEIDGTFYYQTVRVLAKTTKFQ